MGTKIPQERYRADIQGLRAVAVLLVLFFHAGFKWMPGGYVGVDVFFVISGYLITGLLLRELESTGTVAFADFYARRIRRLLPAASIVLLSTMLAALFVYSPLEMRQFSASAFATALYVSNIWFARQSTDYLAEDTDANPLLHTWSLSAEEQIYLVWPVFLVFLARLGAAGGLHKRLLIGIGSVSVCSLTLAVVLTFYNQPWAFFSSPTRVWEFGVGGMIALWLPTSGNHGAGAARVAGLIGVVLIALSAFLFTEHTSFPGFAAVVPVLGAGLAIASAHNNKAGWSSALLSARPLQFVGNISYSLYLWHWPIFLFMGLKGDGIGAADRAAGFICAFALAWLTSTLVENPLRFSRTLSKNVRGSIAAGIVISLCSASLALTARENSKVGAENDSQQRYAAARNDLPRIYRDGCHASFLDIDTPACAFGRESSDFVVVLFGDSHAAQWFPALEKLSEQEGWRLVALTKSGCPSVSFPIHLPRLGRAYKECDEWRAQAFQRIEALRPKIVIIANSSSYHLTGESAHSQRQVAAWGNGVRATLSRLRDLGPAIVLIRDTPSLSFNGPVCLSRAAWHGNDPTLACTITPRKLEWTPFLKIETDELAASKLGSPLDMTDAICPSMPCAIEIGNLILYSDSHHLTASFSRHLADQLHKRLQVAVVGQQGLSKSDLNSMNRRIRETGLSGSGYGKN